MGLPRRLGPALRETPQLGGKIGGDEFQRQFLKKSLTNAKWMLEKDGGDIRAISGASYSSGAVTGAVKEILEFYQKAKEDLKKKAIFFDGTIIRDSDGRRSALYLDWGGGEWFWSRSNLDDDWNDSLPSLVLAS